MKVINNINIMLGWLENYFSFNGLDGNWPVREPRKDGEAAVGGPG